MSSRHTQVGSWGPTKSPSRIDEPDGQPVPLIGRGKPWSGVEIAVVGTTQVGSIADAVGAITPIVSAPTATTAGATFLSRLADDNGLMDPPGDHGCKAPPSH